MNNYRNQQPNTFSFFPLSILCLRRRVARLMVESVIVILLHYHYYKYISGILIETHTYCVIFWWQWHLRCISAIAAIVVIHNSKNLDIFFFFKFVFLNFLYNFYVYNCRHNNKIDFKCVCNSPNFLQSRMEEKLSHTILLENRKMKKKIKVQVV